MDSKDKSREDEFVRATERFLDIREKLILYFMALDASALAFIATQITKDSINSLFLFMSLSIVCFVISFCFGWQSLSFLTTWLGSQHDFCLNREQFIYPEGTVLSKAEKIDADLSFWSKDVPAYHISQQNVFDKSKKAFKWHTWLFVAGVIAYIIWRTLSLFLSVPNHRIDSPQQPAGITYSIPAATPSEQGHLIIPRDDSPRTPARDNVG